MGDFAPDVLAVVFGQTQDVQKPGWDMERQRVVSGRIVDRLVNYVADGNWLDVGFGNASLLFAAQEWGFHPVGIDLRVSCVEALKVFGIEAHCVDINEWDAAGRFSVIVWQMFLNICPFQKRRWHRLTAFCEPVVLYSCQCQIAKARSGGTDAQNLNPYWAEIEHYHNFGRTRLCRLLEEMGFQPVRYAISERYRAGMEIIALRV